MRTFILTDADLELTLDSHPEELDEMDEDEDEGEAEQIPPPVPKIPERFANGSK